jgi:hypothetical protein
MNIAKMMKQAREMQDKMQKIQEEIAAQHFEADSGGGAVKAKANGEGQLLEIKVSPEVLSQNDPEILEELILTAANAAIKKGKDHAAQRMSSLTAGLGLPGL